MKTKKPPPPYTMIRQTILITSLASSNLLAQERRELSADRPDATESPITVDRGLFQIEASLYDLRRDDDKENHTFMATNIKYGLTDHSDIQFVFDAYSESASGERGFSDLTLRYKHNIWGNDGGDTALALFPYVKIPTGTEHSNDHWEGGLIIPFSKNLSEGVGLGLMAEFDSVYDAGAGKNRFEFLHSAVLGFDLSEKLGLFVEYIGIITEDDYLASSAGGFTYAVHDELLLDIGTQVGLNSAAEDFGLFSGFTVRF